MTNRVTFKKFLAIFVSVLMVFGFAAASVQSVYADSVVSGRDMGIIFYADRPGSHNFTTHDQALFLSAFTRSCHNLPFIPFEGYCKEVSGVQEFGVHPDYNYYFYNSLGDIDEERIDIICGTSPMFTQTRDYYLSILDNLYTYVLGLGSKAAFDDYEKQGIDKDELIEDIIENRIYDYVYNVVDVVYDAAFRDTVYDVTRNPGDHNVDSCECIWDIDDFYEQTRTVREQYALDIAGKLVYSYIDLLPDEEVSAYGSIFSQGSSYTMLALSIAEAVVIIVLLAKGKKSRKEPAK